MPKKSQKLNPLSTPKTIYVVLNIKGGRNGDITFVYKAFTALEEAELCIAGKPHLMVHGCPLDNGDGALCTDECGHNHF